VVRTRVGYAGGTSASPTYRNIGDHSETIQIVYDPTQISYEELLDVFWQGHNPVSRPWSRQYMSAIFYHDEAQRQLALASKAREEARRGREMYTEIIPAEAFYLAEAYHQKYRLRQMRDIVAEYQRIYPETRDFIDSTAVARVNGYLGGSGKLADLERELESLGLSPAGQKKLLDIVSAWNP